MSTRVLWLLLLLVGIVVALVWWTTSQEDSASRSQAGRTTLEIEFDGGFAFVAPPSDNHLEIGFPANPNLPYCNIEPLATHLVIVSGNLVEPSALPAGGLFDLTGAVVQLPALESANLPLAANRPPGRPNPNKPKNPDDVKEWESLQWIVNITGEHTATTLNPSWRSLVNGRVVLRGGTLKGLQPSDVVVSSGMFEFRNSAGPVFQQAMTDKAHYSVDVPDAHVEMLLEGAKSGLRKIVVAPIGAGAPVVLKLMGSHQSTPAELPIGAPVDDFCVFYPLLQPVPNPGDWLKPVYIGKAVEAGPPGASPNPGPFCPPTFFP